jgi:hypothetical protein
VISLVKSPVISIFSSRRLEHIDFSSSGIIACFKVLDTSPAQRVSDSDSSLVLKVFYVTTMGVLGSLDYITVQSVLKTYVDYLFIGGKLTDLSGICKGSRVDYLDKPPLKVALLGSF